jgi:hypothetical protein
VNKAVEKKNRERLIESCFEMSNEEIRVKTKTQHIIKKIEATNYIRKPQREIVDLPKHITRTVIIAQYGMLEYAGNYVAKYGGKMCQECKKIDDEEH